MPRSLRTPKPTLKARDAAKTSFKIEWPEELEIILIEIIRRYIEGEKLADNIFKAQDYIAITIKI